MLSNKSLGFLFLISLLLLLTIEVWANTFPRKSVEIRINQEVLVSSPRLVLGDIATIYAKKMADFEKLSGLIITQFPVGKTEVNLPASYLRERIKEALDAGEEFDLYSPKSVQFKLDRMGISPDEFGQELLAKGKDLKKIPENIEVEIMPIAGFDQLKLMRPEEYQLEPGAETVAWKGEMTFKMVPKSSSLKIVWLRARVRWFTDVWAANKDIFFAETLNAEMFKKQKLEVTEIREPLVSVAESLDALVTRTRAKRSIRQNMPLTVAMLDRKPDGVPGQKLKVVFISESGLRISTEGLLVGAAAIGADVKAKLKSSKKIVSGKLVSEGTMEVTL